MKTINLIKKISEKLSAMRIAFVNGFKEGFENKWNQTSAKTKYGIPSPIRATQTVNDSIIKALLESQIHDCDNRVSFKDIEQRFGK